MGTHNVKPHTRLGKQVAGSTRKNPGRGASSEVVDTGRQDKARAAALADAESGNEPDCEADRSAAEARAEGRCTGITPHGPCRLPAEDGTWCEPHANDRLDDPRISAGVAAHTASELAASEAAYLGKDEDWAKVCAEGLERSIIRTHAAADGAEAAAQECDDIMEGYKTSAFRGDYGRMVDLSERAKRLAREARAESETAADPGCVADVSSASGMAQSLAAEVRGCRDAMKAIVNADGEDPTYDEVVQRSKAMLAEANALHEECVRMRDDETLEDAYKQRITEVTSKAHRDTRELSYKVANIANPELLVRGEFDDARDYLYDVRGAKAGVEGYIWAMHRMNGDTTTPKPAQPSYPD